MIDTNKTKMKTLDSAMKLVNSKKIRLRQAISQAMMGNQKSTKPKKK